ncbi:MAG TPA: hypothetical protein VGR70_05380 [Stellaceae bacterium]|nr:hypothetical protein [Stellaceae bacterium]
MAEGSSNDAQIIAAAYADRVTDLFKVFAEAVATGEPDRDAVVRFKRGLIAARRVRDLALEAAKDTAEA